MAGERRDGTGSFVGLKSGVGEAAQARAVGWGRQGGRQGGRAAQLPVGFARAAPRPARVLHFVTAAAERGHVFF